MEFIDTHCHFNDEVYNDDREQVIARAIEAGVTKMLQADIATLRTEFDGVFLCMPDGLRRGGSFFSQLLGACESAIIEVAAGVTPRAELSYVRRHVKEVGKPMMGLVTGASAKVVRKEMEASK